MRRRRLLPNVLIGALALACLTGGPARIAVGEDQAAAAASHQALRGDLRLTRPATAHRPAAARLAAPWGVHPAASDPFLRPPAWRRTTAPATATAPVGPRATSERTSRGPPAHDCRFS